MSPIHLGDNAHCRLHPRPGRHWVMPQVLSRVLSTSNAEELARTRRVEDLVVAAVGNDPRAERVRRVAKLGHALCRACFSLLTPTRAPASTSAWRTQLRNVSAVPTPNLVA